MKIQTTALVTSLTVDGTPSGLDGKQEIDLEFSAIDTGGGFKDPILDFSLPLHEAEGQNGTESERHRFELRLRNPNQEDSTASFVYEGRPRYSESGQRMLNGRLKDEQLDRELIGFVLKLIR